MQSFVFAKEKDGKKMIKSISYFNGVGYPDVLEDFEDWCAMQEDADDLYIPCDDTGKVYDWSRIAILKRRSHKDSWTIFNINPSKHKRGEKK